MPVIASGNYGMSESWLVKPLLIQVHVCLHDKQGFIEDGCSGGQRKSCLASGGSFDMAFL